MPADISTPEVQRLAHAKFAEANALSDHTSPGGALDLFRRRLRNSVRVADLLVQLDHRAIPLIQGEVSGFYVSLDAASHDSSGSMAQLNISTVTLAVELLSIVTMSPHFVPSGRDLRDQLVAVVDEANTWLELPDHHDADASVAPETAHLTVDAPPLTVERREFLTRVSDLATEDAARFSATYERRGSVVRIGEIAIPEAARISATYERLERYIEQVLADDTRHLAPDVEHNLIAHRKMLDAWQHTEAQDPVILERIVAGYSRLLPDLLETDPAIDPSQPGALQAQDLRTKTQSVIDAITELGDPDEETAADQLVDDTLPALVAAAEAAGELAAEFTDDPFAKASLKKRVEDLTARLRSGNQSARPLVDELTESRAIFSDAIKVFTPSGKTVKTVGLVVTGALAYLGWVTETIHAIWHWLPLT